MSLSREELSEAVRSAFAADGLAPDRDLTMTKQAELGLLALRIPEALGGLGLRHEATAAVHVELGRVLAPGPSIAQELAVAAIAASGEAYRSLVERGLSGEVFTTSLVPPTSPNPRASAVPDADTAGHLVIVEPQRIRITPLAGARLTLRDTWDRTRRLFDVEPATDGETLAEGPAAARLAEALEAQLLLALAADSVGGAAAILELTVDYLKTRRQFDRPLAMFQALKHRLADLHTRWAMAEALLWARASGRESRDDMAALKLFSTNTYRHIAEEAIQLHGGIGLTAEHHCHLFLKRAMLNAALGGDNDGWEEVAGRALIAGT